MGRVQGQKDEKLEVQVLLVHVMAGGYNQETQAKIILSYEVVKDCECNWLLINRHLSSDVYLEMSRRWSRIYPPLFEELLKLKWDEYVKNN